MVYPGSFIWKHLSDDWLVGRRANQLFAFFSVVIVGTMIALYNIDRIPHASAVSNIFWGVVGALAGFGVFFVWGGMWRYWIEHDPSSRAARRIWFVVLLFGLWYGAILYYVCVYLPATGRDRKRATEGLVR